MKNEKLYIYFYTAQIKQAGQLQTQIQSFGLEAELINLDDRHSDVELVNGLVEQSEAPFPILRIGEQKIIAVFYKPSNELLDKLFSHENMSTIKLSDLEIYSSTHCGACTQLKLWFDSQKIEYSEIQIQDSEALKQQIISWSGGRRVVPTINYKSIGRLFNPGISTFQKLYK